MAGENTVKNTVENTREFEHLSVKRTFCIGSQSQFGVPSFLFALFNLPSK